MSLFNSKKEKEDLREEYIEHLKSFSYKETVYSEGHLWWKKRWTVKDMIDEMENKTKFSNKILHNIQVNRIFTD